MESELRITKVTTYSARVIQLNRLRPKIISSTPVRRTLVYHDITESTINGSRMNSMHSLVSSDSLENLDQLLCADTNPLRTPQPKPIECTEEKEYECQICGLTFFHAMSRDAHILSHTGTLPRRKRKSSKTPTLPKKLTKIARLDEKTPSPSPFKRSFKKLRASLRRKKPSL